MFNTITPPHSRFTHSLNESRVSPLTNIRGDPEIPTAWGVGRRRTPPYRGVRWPNTVLGEGRGVVQPQLYTKWGGDQSQRVRQGAEARPSPSVLHRGGFPPNTWRGGRGLSDN
jgi:hypothetical protein